MSDAWGPWIEHDGHSMPDFAGQVVQRHFDQAIDLLNGQKIQPTRYVTGPIVLGEVPSWLWCLPTAHPVGTIARVTWYRIRRHGAVRDMMARAQEAHTNILEDAT